ncbi:unnamed protein product [Discosporangium mesarthrocarpum]
MVVRLFCGWVLPASCLGSPSKWAASLPRGALHMSHILSILIWVGLGVLREMLELPSLGIHFCREWEMIFSQSCFLFLSFHQSCAAQDLAHEMAL